MPREERHRRARRTKVSAEEPEHEKRGDARKTSHAIRGAASLPAVRKPSVNVSENGSTSRTPVFRQMT